MNDDISGRRDQLISYKRHYQEHLWLELGGIVSALQEPREVCNHPPATVLVVVWGWGNDGGGGLPHPFRAQPFQTCGR